MPTSELAYFYSIILAFLAFISHLPRRPPPKSKQQLLLYIRSDWPKMLKFRYHDTGKTCCKGTLNRCHLESLFSHLKSLVLTYRNTEVTQNKRLAVAAQLFGRILGRPRTDPSLWCPAGHRKAPLCKTPARPQPPAFGPAHQPPQILSLRPDRKSWRDISTRILLWLPLSRKRIFLATPSQQWSRSAGYPGDPQCLS